MTNADYCCWKGKKGEKDFTIGKKTFQNLDRNFWHDMVYDKSSSLKGETLLSDSSGVEKKVQTSFQKTSGSADNAKNLRQAWLDKILKNK